MRFEFGAQSMEVMILSCYNEISLAKKGKVRVGVLLKESLLESNRGRYERESEPR